MAILKITDENSFDIITQSNMNLKFIESERSDLILYMQEFFNNRFLKYRLILVETETINDNTDKPLNSKEQYKLLSEEYPLIKELKDRLKLELDF